MKDRNGYEYTELVDIQTDCLLLWKPKLRPDLFKAVHAYLDATNLPAPKAEDKHRVYRGQDLVQIILEWPDLSPAYAVVEKPAEELI